MVMVHQRAPKITSYENASEVFSINVPIANLVQSEMAHVVENSSLRVDLWKRCRTYLPRIEQIRIVLKRALWGIRDGLADIMSGAPNEDSIYVLSC